MNNKIKTIRCNDGIEIHAYTIQQYNMWKDYLKGNIPISEMFILAQTYNELIFTLFTAKEIDANTDHDIFVAFAAHLKEPK